MLSVRNTARWQHLSHGPDIGVGGFGTHGDCRGRFQDWTVLKDPLRVEGLLRETQTALLLLGDGTEQRAE